MVDQVKSAITIPEPVCPCGFYTRERRGDGYRKTCRNCRQPTYFIERQFRKSGIVVNSEMFVNYAQKFLNKKICESCGFIPVHPCQLDVDHKDGNHLNDDPDNLQNICANCHRLKTFISGDHRKGGPGQVTPGRILPQAGGNTTPDMRYLTI